MKTKQITKQEFRELMAKGTYVEAESEIFNAFHLVFYL